MKGHITIDKARCKACAFCIDFCPKGCIELSDELNLKGYFVARFKEDGGAGARGQAADEAAVTAAADAANTGPDAATADASDGEDGVGCNGCGICALMCPEVAIEVVRG